MTKVLVLVFVCLSILTCEGVAGIEPRRHVAPPQAANAHYSYLSQSAELESETASSETVSLPQHHRVRRQFVNLNTDHRGAPQPVAKPQILLDVKGSGNRKNHDLNVRAGLGTVLWRSRNDKHTVGVGATFDHHRTRTQGITVTTKPNIGVGVGYKFQFG